MTCYHTRAQLMLWGLSAILFAILPVVGLGAQPHNSTVMAIAYSPNGNFIATGGGDQTVKIWDAATAQNVQTLQGHTREIFDVAWSPDSSRLASADAGSTVLIWDTTTWQNTLTIVDEQPNVALFDLDWKPNGTQIAVSDDHSSVSVYDTTTGALVRGFIGHVGPISAVAWSPDGNYILSGGWDSQLVLWDASSGQEINRMTELNSYGVEAIDWHPNGLLVAVGNGDGYIRVWNPFSANIVASIAAHSSQVLGVLAVDWSDDGSYLASGGGDETIRIWNGSNYNLVQTISVGEIVNALSFHPTDDVVAYYSESGIGSPIHFVPITQPPTPTPTFTPTPTNTPAPTATPFAGGGYVVFQCGFPQNEGICVADGFNTFFMEGSEPSIGGGNLVASAYKILSSGGIQVLDTDDNSYWNPVGGSGTYASPSLSADGTKIAYAYKPNGSNTKYVIRTANIDGTGVQTLTATNVNSLRPHWSPNGTKIVFYADTDGDNEIYTMNANGSNVVKLTNNTSSDIDPRWSPDGAQIVFSANRDGNQEIYRMNANGSSQTRLTNNSVADVEPTWSPDGTQIVFVRGSTIYGMNASNGGGLTQITNGRNPDWGFIIPPEPGCEPGTCLVDPGDPPEE